MKSPKLLIAACTLIMGFNALSQYEDCATAASNPIIPDGTCYLTNTVGAIDNIPGEVGCATLGGNNGHLDQWFSFVATDAQFDINVTNTGAPTTVLNNQIEVLLISGTCGALTLEFSTCGAMPLVDQFVGLIPGNTYFVCVSTNQGGSNDGSFNVCIDNNPVVGAPPNDDCTGAIAVPTNGSCTAGTTVSGNDSWTGEVGCATAGPSGQHIDVWYSFVATAGVVDITANDFTIGSDLEIILVDPGATPCVSPFTLLDSYCGPSPLTGTYAGLTPGNTYYYTISSSSNAVGTFESCVTTYNITNDDCAGAIPVTVGTNGICNVVVGTNIGATATAGVPAPSCGNYLGGDVWYSITVPASGQVTFGVDFAAANSLSDVDIEIYSGVCGALTSIACDDNSGTGSMPDIQASGLAPGTTIYIRVWENGNDLFGSFNLCISEPPVILLNQDCDNALPICSNANFAGASNGSGSINDLAAGNQDCLASGENQTSWLYLEISAAGTFMFTISPDNGSDDYDFGVWHYPGGLGQACPPADGTMDRCSWGAGAGFGGSYDTGLDDGTLIPGGPGDNSEGAGGDNWVNELNVAAGDAIMLVIDNYSSTTSPYTLDFTGTAGLDCSVLLPVELLTFYAEADGRANHIVWKTLTEKNNDYFTIQHSLDGKSWETIGIVDGAGSSQEKREYSLMDLDVEDAVNFYRLYQTDFNGLQSSPRIVSINNSLTGRKILYTTNLIGQQVDENFHGVVIDIYENGQTVKRIQQ